MFNDLHIVAIDDEEFNLILLEEISKNICLDILTFLNPKEALQHIESHHVDILLVDYMMPEINGIEVIKRVHNIDPSILCIMITASGEDENIKLKALSGGAIDFLKKPINVAEYRARMKNVSRIKNSEIILNNFNSKLEYEIEQATKKLKLREQETLKVLGNTVEYKDPETAGHIARVSYYSKLIAEKYGFNEIEQDIIFHASALHDIGKVGIKDSILLKPGKLDTDEFIEMKKHSKIGFNILKDHENPYLIAGSIIANTHHEKYDGSGYPNSLFGEDIHIYGRITAIADVFDALTSVRPYKKAWEFDKAIEFLKEQRGKHFDPVLCEIFMENIDEVDSIYNRFKN